MATAPGLTVSPPGTAVGAGASLLTGEAVTAAGVSLATAVAAGVADGTAEPHPATSTADSSSATGRRVDRIAGPS